MPRVRQYDKDGKMYAWSDDGFAVRLQAADAFATAPWAMEDEAGEAKLAEFGVTMGAWTSEPGECTPIGYYDGLSPEENKGHEYREDYSRDNLHGIVDGQNIIQTENPSVVFRSYLNPKNIAVGNAMLDTMRDAWRKKAKTIPKEKKYDSIRRYCETEALYADKDAGDYCYAMANSPYLSNLQGIRAKVPKFTTMDMDKIIDGMGQNVFDQYMDLVNAGADELRAEYKRQKLEKEMGVWNADAEGAYLSALKTAHEKTISAFDKIWEMEDHGQYDQYLNSPWDDNLGKSTYKPMETRAVTQQVGIIRGELQAIENGWGGKDLKILGIIGGIEAKLQRERLAFPNDVGKKQQADAIEKDLQKLKKSVWNQKIQGPDEKALIVMKVRDFLGKHQDNEYVKDVYGTSKEVFDAAMANVDAEAKRFQTEQKDAEDKTFRKLQEMEEKGNWRGILEKLSDIELRMGDLPNKGEQNASRRFLDGLVTKDKKGNILPEKQRVVEGISRELGRMWAEDEHKNPDRENQSSLGTGLSSIQRKLTMYDEISATVMGVSNIGHSEKNTALFAQNATAEEMQRKDQALRDVAVKLSEYQAGVVQAAAKAREALTRLDSKKKWWASDNQEYKDMRSALEAVSKLDDGKTPVEVNDALKYLEKKAKIYEETHLEAGSSLGQHRLNMSRELKAMAAEQAEFLRGGNEEEYMNREVPLKHQIEATQLAINEIDKAKKARNIQYDYASANKQGAAKKKINLKALQEEMKKAAPEQGIHQKDFEAIQKSKLLQGFKKDAPDMEKAEKKSHEAVL